MGTKGHSFCVGDQVTVRAPQEILATLDGNGTLDGLPFMPEMLDWCGKKFFVQRRVEKTCVADHPMRRFPANDVVILDGARCDGSGHDGCKHGCRIYWKEAWLASVNPLSATAPISRTAFEALRARLRVKKDDRRYFCQSTEMYNATEAFPGKQKPWKARIILRELRAGELSLMALAGFFVFWSWQRILRRGAGCDAWLHGRQTRTPRESLNLKPGELVRVKTRSQIVESLDQKGRNRGMAICYEMTRCCGGEAEVRYRVDRIIDERTGVMRDMSDTVTLQNVKQNRTLSEECLCYDQLGDCPRGELMYWREIWLERVNPSAANRETPPPPGRPSSASLPCAVRNHTEVEPRRVHDGHVRA